MQGSIGCGTENDKRPIAERCSPSERTGYLRLPQAERVALIEKLRECDVPILATPIAY